jgi:kynurenine 3-monooxygenase
MHLNGRARIIGAGCSGPLLATLLASRGLAVTLHERRPDPRSGARESGRTINLALAARGLRALERANLRERIEDLLVPMRGRMVHAPDGTLTFLPYGRLPGEFIWSVSRGDMNERLLSAAEERGAELRFGERCTGVDFLRGELTLETVQGGPQRAAFSPAAPLFAADGVRSGVRQAMEKAGLTTMSEDTLSHGYKELNIPPAPGGGFRMEREALHIWPRGSYMLIALPNTDGSFTATLFFERHGPGPSFDSLTDAASVEALFARDFADAAALMPDLAAQFLANPAGTMSTLQVSRWHHESGVLLLGDAAHGIVPFHGQGMNCAFEDCAVLAGMIEGAPDWNALFTAFAAQRQPDTAAIARMALENYEEMRNTVRDPRFQLQKALSLELERRHPLRFIPRYSMVSFHAEIPYSVAERRGAIQQRILEAALHGRAGLEDLDHAAIDAMIAAELEPLGLPGT